MQYEKTRFFVEQGEWVGIVIDDGEKKGLYELCVEYGVPIHYPWVFKDRKPHYMWGLSLYGIGLLGTFVMMRLPTILHGLTEVRAYLEQAKERKER